MAKRLSTFDYMTQGRQQQKSKHETGKKDVSLQMEDLSQVRAPRSPIYPPRTGGGPRPPVTGTGAPDPPSVHPGLGAAQGHLEAGTSVLVRWGWGVARTCECVVCVCVMQCTCGVLCMWVFGESCECVCCVVSEFTLHKVKPAGLTPFRPTHFCSSLSELTFSL